MPRPRHSWHGSVIPNEPWFLLSWPVPWHEGHIRGTVPALAPVPWQVGHGPSPVSRSPTVVPSIESLKVSVVSVSTSAPRRGRFWAVVRPPPRLNTVPNRSPRPLPASPALPSRSPRSKLNPPLLLP